MPWSFIVSSLINRRQSHPSRLFRMDSPSGTPLLTVVPSQWQLSPRIGWQFGRDKPKGGSRSVQLSIHTLHILGRHCVKHRKPTALSTSSVCTVVSAYGLDLRNARQGAEVPEVNWPFQPHSQTISQHHVCSRLRKKRGQLDRLPGVLLLGCIPGFLVGHRQVDLGYPF